MIPVLDEGYVQLVQAWGSDEDIVRAARMSTDKGFQGWEKDEKLLRFLWTHKHLTPFEMCGAIFEVKLPIFVVREWHRHRTQSYNEMSARYIPLPNENYIPEVPDLLRRSKAAAETKNRQASGTGVVIDSETAREDIEELANVYHMLDSTYRMFLEHGWPKEMARVVIPVGRYTKMRCSANLRNWLHFLDLRCDPGAQEEIRRYAQVISGILTANFPKTLTLWATQNLTLQGTSGHQ